MIQKLIFITAAFFLMVSALCGSLAYAEEVKAPNAIFRKVEDVLTPKQMEAAGIAAGKYIAVYPTQLSDPITKDGQYIIANNFGPEATKKAEKGEPIPYYLTSQYLKDHQNLLVPITKPASAPTAPAVTAQKPPAGTATDIVKPPKAIYGELVEVELGSGITVFVIRRTDEDGKPIMVPDPKNPGKMIFEDTTPFADIIPDPKNPGKFKFDTKKTVNVEPVLVGFDSFDELSPGDGVYYQRITDAKGNVTIKLINPSPPVDWDTPWYKNGKQVGIIEKTYTVSEKNGLEIIDNYKKISPESLRKLLGDPQPPVVQAPATKPVAPPAEEGEDYQAPSALYEKFQNLFDWRSKPATDPAKELPKESPAVTADPDAPKGRQPRKPRAEAPVVPPISVPVKDAAEDVPGVSATPSPKGASLNDLDSWDPVTAPMTLSPEEIKAGYKPEGFSSKELKDASGKTTGYEVGIAFCRDGVACGPIKKATDSTFENAKAKAMAAAKAAYEAQFPASKNQFIMPGSMKK